MLKISKNAQKWKDKYLKLQADNLEFKKQFRKVQSDKLKARANRVWKQHITKGAKLADMRIDRRLLNRTGYFDAIFSYMTIVAFAYGKELSPTAMAYLTLLNLVPKLTVADCKKFGFKRSQEVRVYLEKLVDMEYSERFEVGAKVVYSVSMKGKKTFNDFRQHHRNTIKNLKDNNEYKRAEREWGNNPD